MSEFYDINPAWNKRDINGNKPGVLLLCGNRTAGKTFSCKEKLIRRYIDYGEQFAVYVRFNNEMAGFAESFWKDVGNIKFPTRSFSDTKFGDNMYLELWLDGECCGFVTPLNSADKIKKYSSRFVGVKNIFMDEFQSETGHYVPNELMRFECFCMSTLQKKNSPIGLNFYAK